MIRAYRCQMATLIGVAFFDLAQPGTALADRAAITSQTAEQLSVIDLARGEIVAHAPVPGKPAALTVDAGRGRIHIVATEGKTLQSFDLDGKAISSWPLLGAPFGIALLPLSGHVVISDQNGALREIDPATGQTQRMWQVGATPAGLAVQEGMIVVANRDADSVSLLTPERRDIEVGSHPFGVTLYQGRAFVTNVLSDSVSVIDLAQAAVIATIPTGARPYAIAFAKGRGFVSNQYDASLSVFDAESYAPIGTIDTDDYPEGLSTSSNGAQIILANWFSDSVQIIDAETLEITATIAVAAGPRAFGSFAWGH